MAENSNIEWTDHTFNPWEGCQKVGPGCDNCYAEARDKRFTGGQHWGPGAPRRRTSRANWNKPLKWDAAARDNVLRGLPRPRVFCASLADVFDNAVDPQWRADLFDLIRATPNLDWLLLTKRPGNIAKMLPADWGNGWPNVWLGCTIVNQEEADRDIPKLLNVPAAVRFLSMEPLLGPVDLLQPQMGAAYCATHCQNQCMARGDEECPKFFGQINWVIAGGESGANARPMHPDWARSIRDQCEAAGVPYFHKQNGEFVALNDFTVEHSEWWNSLTDAKRKAACGPIIEGRQMIRVGKSRAGRLLDGRTHDDTPGVK